MNTGTGAHLWGDGNKLSFGLVEFGLFVRHQTAHALVS